MRQRRETPAGCNGGRNTSPPRYRFSTRPLKKSISPSVIRSTQKRDLHTAALRPSERLSKQICCRETGLRIRAETISAVSDACDSFSQDQSPPVAAARSAEGSGQSFVSWRRVFK